MHTNIFCTYVALLRLMRIYDLQDDDVDERVMNHANANIFLRYPIVLVLHFLNFNFRILIFPDISVSVQILFRCFQMFSAFLET